MSQIAGTIVAEIGKLPSMMGYNSMMGGFRLTA
jgi:hypothetical protein